MHASIAARLEALVSIDSQVGKLDAELKELAGRNEVAWRLMSVPGIGPITVMAFIAAIEDVNRFVRTRDIGAYLGLTEKRYQSAESDIRMGISKQGDAMARHYLYEAANVLLTTVKKRFALRSRAAADEEGRAEAGPRGGREEARGAAWADVEGRHAL